MSESLLHIENLHMEYEKGAEILKGIDFDISKGEVVAILGPSGSGKTTFLRSVSFLEKATDGEMDFDGMHIQMNSATKKQIRDARMKMGYVFQNFNLFNNMTVIKNVLEGLTTARRMDKAEALKIAEEVLEKVGMSGHKDRYPSELSGGQQQRVAIARAVAINPKIILLDEPTSALDPELVNEVMDVLRRLAKSGATMILVTHHIEFAKEIASRVIFMDGGVVMAEGTPSEVIDNPNLERTRQFFKKVSI